MKYHGDQALDRSCSWSLVTTPYHWIVVYGRAAWQPFMEAPGVGEYAWLILPMPKPMSRDFLPITRDTFFDQLAADRSEWGREAFPYAPMNQGRSSNLARFVEDLFNAGHHPQIDRDLGEMGEGAPRYTSDRKDFPALRLCLGLRERPGGLAYFGLVLQQPERAPLFLALYRGPDQWRVVAVPGEDAWLTENDASPAVLAALDAAIRPSPALAPCPFCGHDTPVFERLGTPRQSCIVACGMCGARVESGDEGERNGSAWNQLTPPPALKEALGRRQHTAYLDSAVSVQVRTADIKAVLGYWGICGPSNR